MAGVFPQRAMQNSIRRAKFENSCYYLIARSMCTCMWPRVRLRANVRNYTFVQLLIHIENRYMIEPDISFNFSMRFESIYPIFLWYAILLMCYLMRTWEEKIQNLILICIWDFIRHAKTESILLFPLNI